MKIREYYRPPQAYFPPSNIAKDTFLRAWKRFLEKILSSANFDFFQI